MKLNSPYHHSIMTYLHISYPNPFPLASLIRYSTDCDLDLRCRTGGSFDTFNLSKYVNSFSDHGTTSTYNRHVSPFFGMYHFPSSSRPSKRWPVGKFQPSSSLPGIHLSIVKLIPFRKVLNFWYVLAKYIKKPHIDSILGLWIMVPSSSISLTSLILVLVFSHFYWDIIPRTPFSVWFTVPSQGPGCW